MKADFIHEMLLGLDSAIAVFNECEIVIPENHPDPGAISDCIGNVRTAHAIACKEYRLGQQAPEPVEGWISVDKQLPPEHEKVIVQFGEQNVLMGIMDSNNKWCVFWSDGLNEMDNERPITHWRLSPQPIQP
jgi:hypothetical protein